MDSIADALNISLGAPSITTMVRNGLTYDVILKFLQTDMNDPNKLTTLL